jgi:hypothetical protein
VAFFGEVGWKDASTYFCHHSLSLNFMQIQLLIVTFDTHIHPWELRQFRGAVAAKVGLEHEWFHNHNNETGGFHYRYPLIQYKLDTFKGAIRPMLLCVGQGIHAAHQFFMQPQWQLKIGQTQHDMPVHRLQIVQHQLEIGTQEKFMYRLHKWRPFNEENYQHWRSIRGIAEQFAYLERLLVAHLIAFAAGLDWQVEQTIELKIYDLLKRERIGYKGVNQEVFSLDFETNMHLPDFVGLGKSVALGHGVVRKQRWY